jgi:hypothetical protein
MDLDRFDGFDGFFDKGFLNNIYSIGTVDFIILGYIIDKIPI